MDWPTAYSQNKFWINKKVPSQIVLEGLEILKPSLVLDLGCGNGRNTEYCASLGVRVDAVDISDKDFPKDFVQHINFKKIDVVKLELLKQYDFVIAARLFQYLTNTQLQNLLEKIKASLKKNGLLLISYTYSGGIFTQADIAVKKFHHDPQQLKDSLAKDFKILSFKVKDQTSDSVPYQVANKTCEIIVQTI